MNTAQKFAQLATDLYCMRVLERLPLDGGPHWVKRKQLFRPLLYGKNAGKQYFQTLLCLISRDDCPADHLRGISNRFFEEITNVHDEPMPDAKQADDGDVVMDDVVKDDKEQERDSSIIELDDTQSGQSIRKWSNVQKI